MYITKTAAKTVLPDEELKYDLIYGNLSKQPAQNAYIIDTLPDITNPSDPATPDGLADLKFISIAGSNGESFYYHDAVIGSNPVFDPLNPTNGGWKANSQTLTNPVTHIAILIGNIGGLSSPKKVTLTTLATNPNTNGLIGIGQTLQNKAKITTPDPEEDLNNNDAQALTVTPGLDLAISKKTISPANKITTLNKEVKFAIKVSNNGTVPACSVFVEDSLPAGLEYVSQNFGSLNLQNKQGDKLSPITTTGQKITNLINPTFDLSTGKLRWFLGDTSHPYTNVCLPVGSELSFEITAKTKENLSNSDVLENTAKVGEDSTDIEFLMTNNESKDTVQVLIPDLLSIKTGFSCGVDGVCGNGDDNKTTVKPGQTVQWQTEYNNIGDYLAEKGEIVETIPAQSCFVLNSVSGLQPDASVVYSNNNQLSWDYTPVNSGNGSDCEVTHYKIKFAKPLDAPVNKSQEFGNFDGTKNTTIVDNNQLKIDQNASLAGQLMASETTGQVAGSDWKEVSIGSGFTIALKTNGTLWAWGNNNYGQLGLGDTASRATPTQVGTATNWKSVSSGYTHTMALKTDGTLWAWGENGYGQLGLGDTAQRNTPTRVGTDTNWKLISAGNTNTLATKTDGTLWGWGDYAKLRFSPSTNVLSPILIHNQGIWLSLTARGVGKGTVGILKVFTPPITGTYTKSVIADPGFLG
ncbi:MAG: hypothetical protein ACKO96_24820, partial [Flammeovirgaceae bacterium]